MSWKAVPVGVAYVVAALVGFTAAGANDAVTAVWPPTGIAIAAVVLFGNRIWPGIAAGALIANVINGTAVPLAAAIAVGNTLAPLAAGALLRRVDFRKSFDRLRDTVAFFVVSMVTMTVSATLGTFALSAFGVGVTIDTWVLWWSGDALGAILLGPFILTLSSNDGLLRRRWRQAAVLLVLFTVSTVGAVVTDSALGWIIIPVAMAIAMQLEQQGAATAIVLLTIIDVSHRIVTEGGSATLDTDLAALQGVNATIGFVVFALASIMHERRKAQTRLQNAAAELEQHVAERTDELTRANERLHASQQRLSQAQRLAHIGSFQWDAAEDHNDWTDELFNIYGLDPSDGAPGFDTYISFIRADVRDEVRASIEQGIGEGKSLSHEYPVELRDGTKKWVHAYVEVILNDEGTLVGLRGTCQDITDRKLAETELRFSENRFRALLESAPDAAIIVDQSGKIVLSNTQTTNLFGYDRDELIGQHVEMLVPPEVRDGHIAHRTKFSTHPSIRPMGAGRDLYAQRKDGSSVAVDISLSPVETDNGHLVFALVRDASERRRVEDALRTALDREREAAEDLRKLDRAKNAFLSAVSHELRTPLTAILGFSELLEEETVRASAEMTNDLVGRVRYSAERLNDLLGDLLDLDRLHRGIVAPRRRATNVRQLIARALNDIDLGMHELTVSVDDAVALVDPAHAERIVENLISNAVRYTPPGTKIELRVQATADKGIDLIVEDDGPGVAPELWDTIFEPFVRGDTGTFTQGTGIGLSLVDRFARLHGGIAEVGEREGGGARFTVALPGPHEPVGGTLGVAIDQALEEAGEIIANDHSAVA